MRRRNVLTVLAASLATAGCLQLEESDGGDANGGDGGGSNTGTGDGGSDEGTAETGSDDGSDGGEDEGSDGGADDADDEPQDGEDGGDGSGLEHSRSVTSTESGDEFLAAHPLLEFRGDQTPTLDDGVAFEIRNLDTEEAVTVDVVDDAAVEFAGVALPVYDPEGELRSSTRIPVREVGGEFHEFEVEVRGDETTFSARERATYVVVALLDGDPVDRTSPRPISVGHRKEFEAEVADDYVLAGFNAGELPADADLEGRLIAREGGDEFDLATRYDEEAHRFQGRIERDGVPDGEYEVRIDVFHPETGVADIGLYDRLTVE